MTKEDFLKELAEAKDMQSIRRATDKLTTKQRSEKEIGRAIFEATERIVREQVG